MAIIRNMHQLEGFKEEHGSELHNYVAQSLIDTPDQEYTCAVWRGHDVIRKCTLRRKLQGGMTGWAKVEQHDAIDLTLDRIISSFSGDAFINVQLRMHEGKPYVFEINPRFSSTVMMRHKIGFSDFLWTLDCL
jgi:carbamoyl-phosphate synthase large subunit